MFFCEECKVKNKWPESLARSRGVCEVCGKNTICFSVPSKDLPGAEPEANVMKTMDAGEFKDVQQKIALFGELTADLPIEAFLEEVEKASTLGPLLSPGICDCEWMEKAEEWAILGTKMKEFQDEWKRLRGAKK